MCPVLFLSHVSSCPYLVIFLFLLSSFDYSLITPHLFLFSLITSCVYKSWVPPESLSVLLSFKLCGLCFIIKTIISLPPVSCNLTTHDRDRYKLKLIVNWCKHAVFLLLFFFSQFQIYISPFWIYICYFLRILNLRLITVTLCLAVLRKKSFSQNCKGKHLELWD